MTSSIAMGSIARATRIRALLHDLRHRHPDHARSSPGRIIELALRDMLDRIPAPVPPAIVLDWSDPAPMTVENALNVPHPVGAFMAIGPVGGVNVIGTTPDLHERLVLLCTRGEVPPGTFRWALTADEAIAKAACSPLIRRHRPHYNPEW